MIKIKNLKYKKILKIKKMNFEKNKINILYGKSGSGKSTLLSLILGNDYDYTGNIYLEDKLIKNINREDILKEIKMLDQNITLLSDNVIGEFEVISKYLNIEINQKKIIESLKNVGLNKKLNDSTLKFSGGEIQKLGIARMLYIDSKIIILDEPTSALDRDSTENFMNNLEKISNKTFIIVSHNDDIIKNNKYNLINLGEYNEYY